ncbi:MAG: hypothetical protein IKT98_02880 [Selenomonadaceae bacterium]|nr:hypothetical protein [Selenomonadaceae bacterium]
MFIKKFFGVILLLAMITLSQNVSAEKTDWADRNYYFRNIRTVIVFDVTANYGANYGGSIEYRNFQDTFIDNARRLKCNVITEREAYRSLGYQLGMNLESIAYSNPTQARQIVMQNAYKIADAWVTANVDNLENTYYIEPERTVWEQKKETRTRYDRYGNRHEETYYIQVPVTYPPRRVDVTSIEMTLKAYDARSGAEVFGRRDVRDRKDYQAQKGMFGRITKDFFEDLGKKIR